MSCEVILLHVNFLLEAVAETGLAFVHFYFFNSTFDCSMISYFCN